jgi:hypothetical protein
MDSGNRKMRPPANSTAIDASLGDSGDTTTGTKAGCGTRVASRFRSPIVRRQA